MHREKGKSKASEYTNWHIGSLRMHFAYRECPKLFTYLETKASAKTVKKKRHKHKVLNFSVCAKKCGLRPDNKIYMTSRSKIYSDDVGIFLGGVNEAFFATWPISSQLGVQIGRELVRLITLIGLNKFVTNITSPTSLKKFSRTTFRWSIVKNRSFLVF